jgi:hypothetical protein
MSDSTYGKGGRRHKRHTKKSKKSKKHTRRHTRRGGATFNHFAGVEKVDGGVVKIDQPANVSGSQFTTPQIGQSASSTYAGYGGRSRRGGKVRKSRYRMRGGTGGMGVGYGFSGNTIAGIKPEWELSSTTNHTPDAAGYNRGWSS